MIELNCPQCGHQLKIGLQFAGKVGKCKYCKLDIQVPHAPVVTPVIQTPPLYTPSSIDETDSFYTSSVTRAPEAYTVGFWSSIGVVAKTILFIIGGITLVVVLIMAINRDPKGDRDLQSRQEINLDQEISRNNERAGSRIGKAEAEAKKLLEENKQLLTELLAIELEGVEFEVVDAQLHQIRPNTEDLQLAYGEMIVERHPGHRASVIFSVVVYDKTKTYGTGIFFQGGLETNGVPIGEVSTLDAIAGLLMFKYEHQLESNIEHAAVAITIIESYTNSQSQLLQVPSASCDEEKDFQNKLTSLKTSNWVEHHNYADACEALGGSGKKLSTLSTAKGEAITYEWRSPDGYTSKLKFIGGFLEERS